MITISGVPVKTRLPITVWALAGLVAICLVVPALMHFITGVTATPEAYRASIVALGSPWF
jgi:hypothetical protein